MPIDFPNSPSNGQDFTVGTTTWTYDGTKWNLKTASTLSNDAMPVGSIMWYAGTTAPTGWVACNGASYPISTYPNLYQVIGNSFGGISPNFNVPTISATTGAYYVRYTTAVGTQTTFSLLTAPVGSMLNWPVTSSYPTGWLRADGSAVSRNTYSTLFTLIGTTYGSGDGSTTFNLPNMISAGAGSPVTIIKATASGFIEPSTVSHGTSHVRGGTDVLDGDRVSIDYTPTNYTRNSGASGAGDVTDLTAHLSGINTAFAPAFVTSLPSSPLDGQVIYYRANATDGIIWQLRYNSSSSSSYKWEFIGGGSLYNAVGSRNYNTRESYSALTFGDLTTVGPSIVVPLAGDYMCTFAANVQTGATSANVRVWVTGDSGFNWDADNDAQAFGNSAQENDSMGAIVKRTGVAAGSTIKLLYAVSNAGVACSWFNRRLEVVPIRVG